VTRATDSMPGAETFPVHTSDEIDDVVRFWRRENPDLDANTTALRLRLLSAARQLERVLRREMSVLEMEMWELDMLLSLRRAPDGARRAGELCRLARVTSGAITNRLVRLEERGWIRRDVDPADRRQVIVTLTPAGSQHADRIISIKSDAETSFFSGLPRSTVERLNTDLRDLLISLEAQSDPDQDARAAP
jgi:DNA-binding MarR family transcriptional regulator